MGRKGNGTLTLYVEGMKIHTKRYGSRTGMRKKRLEAEMRQRVAEVYNPGVKIEIIDHPEEES